MRSVGTVGLLGFGVIVSTGFLVRFCNEHFFHKERLFKAGEKRNFSREVDREDFDRNSNAIISGGMFKRSIQHSINNRWDKEHRDSLVDDAVFRKGVNLDADIRFMSENKDNIIHRQMISNSLNNDARERAMNENERYYHRRRWRG